MLDYLCYLCVGLCFASKNVYMVNCTVLYLQIETEREKFIRECLEVVSKIADIFPDEVIVKTVSILL